MSLKGARKSEEWIKIRFGLTPWGVDLWVNQWHRKTEFSNLLLKPSSTSLHLLPKPCCLIGAIYHHRSDRMNQWLGSGHLRTKMPRAMVKSDCSQRVTESSGVQVQDEPALSLTNFFRRQPEKVWWPLSAYLHILHITDAQHMYYR